MSGGYADMEKLRAARRRYKAGAAGRAATLKYKAGAAGRAARRRYKTGAVGKAARRKYRTSVVGKTTHRKYMQGENGKRIHRLDQRKWQSRNPEKIAAHIVVQKALRKGLLTRQPCGLCGSENAHAHHPDYSKPMEIEWLCHVHHMERHNGNDN
jgi:hypothetical protein